MPKKYYLGIDQGTTGTASLLLDEGWNVCGRGYAEIPQIFPRPGWVEHDAHQLFDSLLQVAGQAIRQAAIRAEDICSLGIDNQGETIVAWDSRTGQPLYNAIVWQDKRTADYAQQIKERYGDRILEKTGLHTDSYFGATKMRWLLTNIPEAQAALRRGTLLLGSTDSWFIWKLTGEYVTDVTTASRTMLFNIHTGEWDAELLELFAIPRCILPRVCGCDAFSVQTRPEAFFGASVPIGGGMADQQAALLGQNCVQKGQVKTTYGTGCFMLMHTGDHPVRSQNGLLTTVASEIGGKRQYALDAGIYVAGAAVQWLKNGLGIIQSSDEMAPLAMSIADNGGVYFVPAFSGLAAPYWDEYARGTILGLTAASTKAHIARAVQESIAYQVCDNAALLQKETQTDIAAMRVDGGMTANPFLMQMQADLLGMPVEVPAISECSALGAAYIGALGARELSGIQACAKYWKRARAYEPVMSADQRESLLHQWRRAVERARGWIVSGKTDASNM